MTTDKPGRTKRILAIIGSQRKLGNCELFVKEIAKHIVPDHELNLVRLPALNILPCNGCYRCLDEGLCRQKDDVSFVLEHVASANAVIIASPVYFLGAHGSIKNLLDRGLSFFPFLERMQGKPCILVNSYGFKNMIGTAPQPLLVLASVLGLEIKASVSILAALPGEILTNKSNLRIAEKLGKLLFEGKKLSRKGQACPFCGNDIVQMKRNNFVCTLCHGIFRIDERGRTIREEQGWDMGNIESTRKHREWLKGMKAQFITRRKDFARLATPYKTIGKWLKPD